jgi:hypothetical protein
MQITPKLEIFIPFFSISPLDTYVSSKTYPKLVFKKSYNQVAFPFMCDDDDVDEDVNASSHQIFNSTTLKNNKTNYTHIAMRRERDTD